MRRIPSVAASMQMFALALLVSLCRGRDDQRLFTSMAVEPAAVSVAIIDVPSAWPSGSASAHPTLHLPGASLRLLGVSRLAMSAADNMVIDAFVSTCVARVRLTGDLLSSDEATCFADTATTFAHADVMEHLVCSSDSAADCSCSLPLNRSITPSAADELASSGITVERGRPYVLSSSVAVSGYLLHGDHSGTEFLAHTFPSVTSSWVPAQYVVFRDSERDAETHARWLRVFSPALQRETAAVSAVAGAAHRLQGRLTSQELFYIDHLFSVSPVLDCPDGMRLRDIGGDHVACIFDDGVAGDGGRGYGASLALWFSSDPPPASAAINGGALLVSDCTLESPVLHQQRAFIPWCLRSVTPPDSLLFYPRSSLESTYSEASSVRWIKSTMASDAVHVTRTHLQVLKMQGSAGLCAVVRAATLGSAGCGRDATGHACDCAATGGGCDQQTAVTLMRLEIDTRNVDALDYVLRGGTSSGSEGSCGVVVEQIIATFSLRLPYSSVLKGVDGEQNRTLVHRWPHAHSHCKECVQKPWLHHWLVECSAVRLDVDRVESLLRSSARRFYIAAWRTLQFDKVQVTWVLRSMRSSDFSNGVNHTSYLEVLDAGHVPVQTCLQDGVDTCGLPFCSDLQTPSECIGLPTLLSFVKRVLDMCARRWWADERDHKEHCPGLKCVGRFGCVGLKNEASHWTLDHEGHPWGFEMRVAENPSLTKMISYSLWHKVTRRADIF